VVKGGRPPKRLLVLAIVVAALAGALLALIQGSPTKKPALQGGSRFGAATAVQPGESLIDALAPLLASDPAKAVGTRALSGAVARSLAQLFVIGIDGTSIVPATTARLRAPWGGVVLGQPNYTGPAQLTGLTAGIRMVLATPPLILARQAGGSSNSFPGLPPKKTEPAIGATASTDLVAGNAALVARNLRKLGINGTLAPVADLADDGGPAVDQGYSADPAVATTLVHAAVGGYRAGGLISVVGHFPGEGAASEDPSQGAATVGSVMADLMSHDIKPFAGVASSAPVIQMSDAVYAAFDGVTPATLLTDAVSLLRQRLGFQGVVMSGDLLAVTATTGGTVAQAAVAALKAGCDLLFLPGGATDAEAAYNAVLAAIRQGQLDPQAISRALARVAELKRTYGIS
jgi:beta-N-acetylhexosaminidase